MQTGKILRMTGLVWGQIGYAILLVCILDALVALIIWAFRTRPVNELQFADVYNGASWTAQYYREHDSLRVAWHPYVDYIALPYRGRYFNVGADGLRVTSPRKAAAAACRRPLRIFLFGGSTVFGYGVRDDYTIPSWLQRMLDEKSGCAAVYNYGQDGYVSTQELLFLQEQLRKGNVPDLVIFYDGFNDSWVAVQNGEAGTTTDEPYRQKSFRMVNWLHGEDRRLLYESAAFTLLNHSALGEVAKRIVSLLAPGSYKVVQGELVNLRLDDPGIPGAAQDMPSQIVRIYLANTRSAQALAKQYGFGFLSYWQPSVFQKLSLTPWERRQAESDVPAVQTCIEATSRMMSGLAQQYSVIDISGLFRDQTRPIFVDEVHLSDNGNRLVAERMMRDVMPLVAALSSRTKAHPSASAGPDQSSNQRIESSGRN